MNFRLLRKWEEFLFRALLKQGQTIMSALDDLKAEVAEVRDVQQSAVALIQGLATKLESAAASNDSDAINEVVADLKASSAALAAAVTANTPAAPAPQPTA